MSGDLNSYAAARHYLYGLKHRGALYGIDRMGRFVEALGHPQKRYPVVHVAGTNGKGSTCAMMEAIFREAGLTTGLFTSPHLVHQGERVQINRSILSHADIGRFTHQLRPVAEEIERTYPGHHPTFFEFMTGMAFLRFAEANVDVGIIETGLGGRLDATNVVHPELCIITSIGLDHTEILGPTLAHIAREKAGIIKRGVPLVLGLVPPEAEAVIREVAAAQNSPVHAVREVFGEDASNYPACALSGLYQRRNAATATLAARVLASRFSITDTHIKAALDAVSWPGRWDLHALVDRSIILDATHNEEGCAYLDENLAGLAAEQGRKLTIVAGTLGEARAASLMPVVCRHARDLFLVEPQQPRACSFAQLEACIPDSFTGSLHRSSVRELFPVQGQTTAGCPAETIVATGSIYLIGEIMDAIHHAQPVDEGILQD